MTTPRPAGTGPETPASILEVLLNRAATSAGETAVTTDGRAWKYGELWQAIERFATLVVRSGVEAGDRVVIALPNGIEFFIAFYGVQRIGGIAVPLYADSGDRRLVDIARFCSASLIVVESKRAQGSGRFASVDESSDLPRWQGDLSLTEDSPLSFLQYTSGSTGDPKGVQISHADLIANIEQLIAGLRITAGDVFVSWLPVCHDMGLILMTMVPFYVGAELHLLPSGLGGIRRWIPLLEEKRATFTAAPDFAYRLALRLERNSSARDLSTLRVALDAAEPVRSTTIDEFESTYSLSGVMVAGYGLAEATVGVSTSIPGSAPKIDERGLVSVGRGLPGIDIEILDSASGARAAGGEIGEILVRGPAVTRGYWRRPQLNAACFRSVDGFVHTGDLGYLDAEGELFIAGRLKTVLRHGARSVAPQEVEETVDGLPFVRSSAAVGIDRSRIEGESIHIFVELSGPVARDQEQWLERNAEVVGRFQERLGFRPGRVYFVAAGTIPKTRNGKVKHRALVEQFKSGELRRNGRLLFPEF